MIRRSLLFLRSFLFRSRLEREMRAEMAQHIERAAERLTLRGLSPDEARREAKREFGNVSYLHEEGRLARGTNGVDSLVADVRFAFRHFARTPLSTLTMIAVLSFGIAINVVLFTVVYSFTERPPSGVAESDEMVRIRGSQLGVGSRTERPFAIEEVDAYAALNSHFAAVAAWTSQPVTVTVSGMDESTLTATFVTDDYFDILGVRPLLGRGIAESAGSSVGVLSHTAWTRSFGGDPAVIGRTITLSQVPVTVVGIAPPLFRGAAWEARDDMQIWLPLSSERLIVPRISERPERFSAIGRLHPGLNREAASAAAAVVAARMASEKVTEQERDALPERDPSVDVVPLLADNLEPAFETNARRAKLAFGLLGLLTLLVTCANLGALQTGLALSRRREIAIRMSLGAQRLRLVRQLITESLLLSVFAAIGASLVTLVLFRSILSVIGSFSFELVFDGSTIAFTITIALAAGLLFGLSPALHATRHAIATVLKDSAASVGGGRARLQRGLVVAQIILTQPLAVCIAASVLIGIAYYRANPANPHGDSIVQLWIAAVGAEQSGVASTDSVSARDETMRDAERLTEALRSVSGVSNATLMPAASSVNLEAVVPDSLAGGSDNSETFYLVGRATAPGYPSLMGTPIVLGRDLEPADSAAFASGVIPMVIGGDMARRLWGSTSPIGKRVRRPTGPELLTLEVVGVVDEKASAEGHARSPFRVFVAGDPRLPASTAPRNILLRLSASADVVIPRIRARVRDGFPRSTITELRTLAAAESEERFIVWGAIALFSIAGVMVLLLCALGLYAVVAFAVGQRSAEIAVRMAIGGRAREIVRLFASDGLRLTVIGIVLGLPASVLGLRQLLSLMPNVPSISLTLVLVLVVVGVATVAGFASWVPASRAAKVDPVAILRGE